MLGGNGKLCVIVGVILIVGLLVYFFMARKGKMKEAYSNLGDIDNTGSFLSDSYDLVVAPDEDVPARNYADLIESGTVADVQQPTSTLSNIRPMERLHRIQGSTLMPRTSKNVTPYNIDLADPLVHSYAVNPPRVALKDPQKDGHFATMIRGDIPIAYYANVSLVGRSRYGRDSLRLDGYFSDTYKSLYNKFTGRGYKNMPIKVANQETVMDYIA